MTNQKASQHTAAAGSSAYLLASAYVYVVEYAMSTCMVYIRVNVSTAGNSQVVVSTDILRKR